MIGLLKSRDGRDKSSNPEPNTNIDNEIIESGEAKYNYLKGELNAIKRSLDNQLLEVPNSEDLSEKLFENIAQEAETFFDRDQVEPDRVEEFLNERLVPEFEGGNSSTYKFRFDGEKWNITEDIPENDPSVEFMRKGRDPGKSGKKYYETPEDMWRVREIQPEYDSWAKNPTEETQIVRESAEYVLNQIRESLPRTELVLFGSALQGTMSNGSDIEYSVHIDSRDLGYIDNSDFDKNHRRMQSSLKQFKEMVGDEIAEKATGEALEFNPGSSYFTVRDEDTEFEVRGGRKEYGDPFGYVIGNESEILDFDEYLETRGLELKAPAEN
jgi:predicted nucleotidyltransferase